SRRRHTRFSRDWSSDVCSSDLEHPVVLVGHSGGGNVVWGAADARPNLVARVVFVDTAPPANGFGIGEFAVVNDAVPFPGWDVFEIGRASCREGTSIAVGEVGVS